MQFTGSFEELRIWTVINGGISSVSVRLITKHVSACPRPYPSPPSAALISIQSECWELQQWWGQCRWMGSLPSTAWQHALYVSLHTVGNLLRWEVKWRWMAMGRPCTLPSWKYKSGGSCWWRPAPFYLLFFPLFFLKRQSKSLTPRILSLFLLPVSRMASTRRWQEEKRGEKTKKKIQFYSVGLLQPFAIIRIHFYRADKTTY